MKPRIPSPALSLPGVLEALQALGAAASKAGLPQTTTDLVHLRISQINGCAVCLDMHARGAKKAGETDERLFTVAGWAGGMPPTSPTPSGPPWRWPRLPPAWPTGRPGARRGVRGGR